MREVFPEELLTVIDKFVQGRPQLPVDPEISSNKASQEPITAAVDIATTGDIGVTGGRTIKDVPTTAFQVAQLSAVEVQDAFRFEYDLKAMVSPIVIGVA